MVNSFNPKVRFVHFELTSKWWYSNEGMLSVTVLFNLQPDGHTL